MLKLTFDDVTAMDAAAMRTFLEETPRALCRSGYRARHGIDYLKKTADERVDTEAMVIVRRAYGWESCAQR